MAITTMIDPRQVEEDGGKTYLSREEDAIHYLDDAITMPPNGVSYAIRLIVKCCA